MSVSDDLGGGCGAGPVITSTERETRMDDAMIGMSLNTRRCKPLTCCVSCREYVDAQYYAGAYWAFSPGSTNLHRCKGDA